MSKRFVKKKKKHMVKQSVQVKILNKSECILCFLLIFYFMHRNEQSNRIHKKRTHSMENSKRI